MALIVIIDDRITNRSIYSQLALTTGDGTSVKAFSDAAGALEWLAENSVDLVITDFKMPQMDGAEFTRRARELPLIEDVPIVVITAYADRDFRMKALEAGATDFLHSPVDHYEFQTRVRNLLKMRQQQTIIRQRASALAIELKESEISREKVLRDSKDRLAQVIDTVPAMINATDSEGRYIFINAYQGALAGMTPSQLMGQDAALMFGADYSTRSRSLDELVLQKQAALPSFEEEITDSAGTARIFLTTKSPLRDGSRIGVLTTSLDITARKQAENRLTHLAQHDHLTGLPNRSFLYERLRHEVARGRRGDRSFALHFIDLDRFKSVNDGLGHHMGDRLLRAVAGRLRQVVTKDDIIARFGGDEFAVVQAGPQNSQAAAYLAIAINDALNMPFDLEGMELSISASIGIALYPKDGRDADDLLKNADLAMYRAKIGGRKGFKFFAEDMDTQARDKVLLEIDLRHALARNQFLLHFQPQVNLRTGEIVGAEALLRWSRPGWGVVSPSAFLSIAEESGLIIPINEWVLREACTQAVFWQLLGRPPIRVGVNLSPLQVQSPDFARSVVAILKETGLPPSLLDLELTESILLGSGETALNGLRDLRNEGVQFSIDDFGAGQSSLASLRNPPVNRLKIDRSFIHNLKADANETAIVRAIISLARSLSLDVLAMGVEAADQVARLRAEGCNEAQGYYLHRPQSSDALLKLIQHEARLQHPA